LVPVVVGQTGKKKRPHVEQGGLVQMKNRKGRRRFNMREESLNQQTIFIESEDKKRIRQRTRVKFQSFKQ